VVLLRLMDVPAIARARVRSRAPALLVCIVLAPGLLAGCATPVGVERVDAQSVHRQLTGNVLSMGELSDFSQNVLRLSGITEVAEDDPEVALATIHDAVVTGIAGPNAMFAYAELAFKHAAEGGGRPYYLASAVYAFACAASGVSLRSVQRIWAAHGLQPHRVRRFKLSTDPAFAAKLGLYLDPPRHAIVLSLDEKSHVWMAPGSQGKSRRLA
jgi:hypothetical protein